MTDDTLHLDDVTVCYGPDPAVHHLTAHVPRGRLTALMGPNGAGKSTLLRAILGWHPLTTGTIAIGSIAVAAARGRIGYLPQRTAVDWDFPITVREVVAMGRYRGCGAFRGFIAEDRRAVDSALDELGLTRLADRQIGTLSGGQQQRAVLARAVATGADLFLLDEPFTGLDPAATADLARRLRAWCEQGRLVLAVVHDVVLARTWFEHALLIRTHLVAAGPVTEALADRRLAEAYGAVAVPEAAHV
jgi:ABC-type Mn2+/Zn2+ transport system ATPase subunit